MLTRWHLLLGSTILLGALLLVGCGGHNSNPVTPSVETTAPSRVRGTANVTLVHASPVKVVVEEPEGIASITVRDSNLGRAYYFPKGATRFEFPLSNFGSVNWHIIGIVDMNNAVDSTWVIFKDGRVVKWR